MSIKLDRLRPCPQCGGKADIVKWRGTNIHNGRHIVQFIGYCRTKPNECFCYEMDEAIQDFEAAIEVWNRDSDLRYYELHGLWRASA